MDHPLYAPRYVSIDQQPTELHSEIVPGLFQGGTDDGAWVDNGAELDRGHSPCEFDAVVTLFAWAQPFGWGVEELRYGFMDSHPRDTDMTRVVEAARWAHQRWKGGRRVLIRCQAGLNRSGLLMALVLMLDGHDASDAIRLIRQRRGELALFNTHFVDWLLAEASAALGLDPAEAARFAG
jgi:hypothetical protein